MSAWRETKEERGGGDQDGGGVCWKGGAEAVDDTQVDAGSPSDVGDVRLRS